MNLQSLLIILCVAKCGVEAANILGVFPTPSPSHSVLAKALLKELARRGHQVTMLSPYPLKESMENYTDIYMDGILEYKERSAKKIMNFNSSLWNVFNLMSLKTEGARVQIQSQALDNLMKSNATFDLCLIMAFGSEVLLGLAHHYNIPVIALSTLGSSDALNWLMGAPLEFSYVPNLLLGYADEMTFFQRVLNTLSGILFLVMQNYVFNPAYDAVMHKRFPEAPPLKQLLNNIDLMFFNSHYSIESPRPYLPNMIQVAGLQMEYEELPQDLKKFLDEAKDGAVFFSLGSNLKSSELPKDKLNQILKVFSKFPGYRFLWKFEVDGIELPGNVMIGKWLPQCAVLAHPKLVLFVTHAGLLSLTEAVYHAVPMLAIPGFGDQKANAAKIASKEYGLRLALDDLNEETFYAAISEIINNPKYKDNVARSSDLMRNPLVKPMDTAVYWVEHVLKYKGAKHLRNAGTRLSWYQYFLVDVLAFIVAVAATLILITLYMFRGIFRFFKKKLGRQQKVKKH